MSAVAHPDIWPSPKWPLKHDPATEARIAALVARMTPEEKVGQILQADICCVTPADVKKYHLGSVLNGGNSGPYGDDMAPKEKWLQLADEFYKASVDKSDGGVGIPVIWGIDAVHGNSNIIGATLFPHNIGLGAAHDPKLIERIGRATAVEIRTTGQEWTFAPTVTVPQDYRWGRAYEGYSSNPKLVSDYVGAMIRGLQGPPSNGPLLKGPYVIASTKHFLADGGTEGGKDQGDAKISEQELRDIHGAPYVPAIENGVATVMASFSSWNGVKMTGNKSLLTGVLKDRMNFDGFVVTDWNAQGQVKGCTNTDCPQAINAGVDMYMAPDSWKGLYKSLLAEVKDGTVPMSRLNDAVTRILRVKMRLGVFEAGKPSSRPYSGQWDQLGSPEHRAIAREAVRKSLVLLKNSGSVLPIKPGAKVLVAGDAADDVARQSGGWTLSWQGTGLSNKDFPGATTIWKGLDDAVTSAGGKATLSPDGSYAARPDVAIVVFGETPYAEFQGDRQTLQLSPRLLDGPLATMKKLKAQGIPVVAVMITGRPLFMNPVLNTADAFVTAWLPGSEGEGVADVLVAGKDGKVRYDFTGRLPAAWPATAKAHGDVLFPYGYGLSLADHPAWQTLSEDPGVEAADSGNVWLDKGQPAPSWSLLVTAPDGSDETRVTATPATALDGRVKIATVNSDVQEGARQFAVESGPATIAVGTHSPVDITRETNGELMLTFAMRVDSAPAAAPTVAMACGDGTCDASVPLPMPLATGSWTTWGIPLKCFADRGMAMDSVAKPFALNLQGPATVSLSRVALGTTADRKVACPE
ncbi:exo 1,3/1,4-beta-D-glucan glucohydrolase [Sphingomonadaceae bacterium LXI357]|uniref:Exo 1,3/1,4-beta-D-glucan glucohydrolase n=2 Tax=Stakelama marina TaxID=2826939 RepID=A0A8T4IDN9_9SPHN|nr:exo 1,3/1,4-beta-D-glucan glucohydrolase [Stakelama marina]